MQFLLYYPLKQGLKQSYESDHATANFVFTLLSIKTRIETSIVGSVMADIKEFISYYPLKQGLKHLEGPADAHDPGIYILLSIKTRIETVSGAA